MALVVLRKHAVADLQRVDSLDAHVVHGNEAPRGRVDDVRDAPDSSIPATASATAGVALRDSAKAAVRSVVCPPHVLTT